MNRLDLIIDALSDCAGWRYKDDEKIDKALAAARELQALKPVAYIDKKGSLFNDTTHPHLCTPLYSLNEVTK